MPRRGRVRRLTFPDPVAVYAPARCASTDGAGNGETSTLVVEGGGLRGAFGAGVLSELAAGGAARFDDVVAVSSGAPTAAYLVTGQAADGLRIWEDHTHGAQLISPRNWLRAAPLMDIDGMIDVLRSPRPARPRAAGHGGGALPRGGRRTARPGAPSTCARHP